MTHRFSFVASFAFLAFFALAHAAAPAAGGRLEVARRLEAGETVRIVCFGDSITGVYYHTGGRRAWADLLEIALQRIYPAARIEMTNAGISGHNTVAALARMEADVLRRQPHLVVVMFGMNDVPTVAPADFEGNVRKIVQRARERGAEVVLLTPNSISPDDPRRPPDRLADYAEIIRRVGRELSVPLADAHKAFQGVDAIDRRAWLRLMSDSIHPNLRGHRLFAEEVAWAISGRRISLDELPVLRPALRVRARLESGQPLRVLAMKPLDAMIGPALQSVFPGAQIEVTPWDVKDKTLAAIELEAKERGWWRFRSEPKAVRPDLVVVAVPAAAQAPTPEQFYRSYTWVLNWSQSLGKTSRGAEWDCLAVMPSVLQPEASAAQRTSETLAVDVTTGLDVPCVQRRPDDVRSAAEVLATAIKSLVGPSER